MKYRFFDQVIASDFPLTGLIPVQEEKHDWRIVQVSGPFNDSGFDWFHNWSTPDGQLVMACARNGENYLLKFPGLALFSIDFEHSTILACAEEECPANTLAHLVMDQVIPRVSGHRGRMVIHASAVTLKDGRVLAFTGPSGRGKSTLALALLAAGHRLIADDCLLIENRNGEVYGITSYPSVRLWADSAEAVMGVDGIEGARISKMAHYTSKQQLLFEGRAAEVETRWVKISAIFILDDPESGTSVDLPRFEPAGGMEAVMSLVEAQFSLDVVRKKHVRQNFQVVQSIAGAVPVFHLAYKRDFDCLSQVIEKVAEFLPQSREEIAV